MPWQSRFTGNSISATVLYQSTGKGAQAHDEHELTLNSADPQMA